MLPTENVNFSHCEQSHMAMSFNTTDHCMHHLHDRHSSGVVTDAIMAMKIAGLNLG